MFTFNSTQNPIDPNANADLFYTLLREYRYTAALLLTPSLERSDRSDVLYNMAVLWGYIGEGARAIKFIDRALSAIKKIPPANKVLPRPEKYGYTRALEIKIKSHLMPMKMGFINKFPDIATEDLLIFGAYNANLAGALARRDAYLSGLNGAEFDDFKNEVKGEGNGQA
jgi:hypothetical protein